MFVILLKDWKLRSFRQRKAAKTTRTASSVDGASTLVTPATPTTSPSKDRKETETATVKRLCSLALRFTESRVLTTAVELGLFTALASYDAGSTRAEILNDLYLLDDETGLPVEFFQALVSLQLLQVHAPKGSDLKDANVLYSNSPQASLYLDKSKGRTYLGDVLLDCYGTRQYELWSLYRQSLQWEHDTPTFPTIQHTREALYAQKLEYPGEIISPGAILRLAFGFIPSQVVLAAHELGLFSLLDAAPLTTLQIHQALRLTCRLERTVDFLETLVQYQVLVSTHVHGKKFYTNICSSQAWTDHSDVGPDDTSSTDDTNDTFASPLSLVLSTALHFASTRMYPMWARFNVPVRVESNLRPEQARAVSTASMDASNSSTPTMHGMTVPAGWAWSIQQWLEQRDG